MSPYWFLQRGKEPDVSVLLVLPSGSHHLAPRNTDTVIGLFLGGRTSWTKLHQNILLERISSKYSNRYTLSVSARRIWVVHCWVDVGNVHIFCCRWSICSNCCLGDTVLMHFLLGGGGNFCALCKLTFLFKTKWRSRLMCQKQTRLLPPLFSKIIQQFNNQKPVEEDAAKPWGKSQRRGKGENRGQIRSGCWDGCRMWENICRW